MIVGRWERVALTARRTPAAATMSQPRALCKGSVPLSARERARGGVRPVASRQRCDSALPKHPPSLSRVFRIAVSGMPGSEIPCGRGMPGSGVREKVAAERVSAAWRSPVASTRAPALSLRAVWPQLASGRTVWRGARWERDGPGTPRGMSSRDGSGAVAIESAPAPFRPSEGGFRRPSGAAPRKRLGEELPSPAHRLVAEAAHASKG